jgi:hypothetical protein
LDVVDYEGGGEEMKERPQQLTSGWGCADGDAVMSGTISVVWLFLLLLSWSRVPPSCYDDHCHHCGDDSGSSHCGHMQCLVRLPINNIYEKDLHEMC